MSITMVRGNGWQEVQGGGVMGREKGVGECKEEVGVWKGGNEEVEG